jgi:hypothetical protein
MIVENDLRTLGSFNVAKTNVLFLSQQNDLNAINISTLPPIELNNIHLKYCQFVKNLGVYFDPLLSWEVTKVIIGSLYALNMHRNFIRNSLKPILV